MFFYLEQTLGVWIAEHKKHLPQYHGKDISVLARMSGKLKADKATTKNLNAILILLRWTAILSAVISQIVTILT